MDTLVLIKSYHSPSSLPAKILFVNSKSNRCLTNFLFLYADFSKSLNFFFFLTLIQDDYLVLSVMRVTSGLAPRRKGAVQPRPMLM